MEQTYSQNGKIIKKDPNLKLEGAVFTSLRTYNGKPAFLDEHLDRLLESALMMGFDILTPLDDIKEWIHELIEQASYDPQFLRLVATPEGDIFMYSRHLVFDQNIYQGVKAVTTPAERTDVKAKTYNPPVISKARKVAEQARVYEALLINKQGCITEGAWSNILWVSNDVLHWCDDALSGITQKHVLELAQEQGITVQEAELPIKQLQSIQELFLTQTSKGPVPIIQVDQQIIADGLPGKITQQLMQAFQDLVS